MESTILYLIPALGILGLVVMAIQSAWVSKQPTGEDKMVELATYIAEGAMAFLKGRVENFNLLCHLLRHSFSGGRDIN